MSHMELCRDLLSSGHGCDGQFIKSADIPYGNLHVNFIFVRNSELNRIFTGQFPDSYTQNCWHALTLAPVLI